MSRRIRREFSAGPVALIEALEQRTLLFTNPFLLNLPDVSQLASVNNTVIRVLSTQGAIDLELFDRAGPDGQSASAAPLTAANFLNYLQTGRYDDVFFHRLVPGFVLQGGGFRQQGEAGVALTVATDAPVQNEFSTSRSNRARTLAMAKRGGDPDSATNQFFINLNDNGGVPPSGLDFQNGGFSVFARVVNDASWTVVQQIAALNQENLNEFLTGAPSGAFGEVPVAGEISPGIPRLVKITDIDVIKAAGASTFFNQSIFFPDGFRSGRIESTVTLVNGDPNNTTFYEIITRYEVNDRDEVVTGGRLAPGAKLTVPISRGGNPGLDLVRPDTPFAYEIRSTGPIAASLQHTDFGARPADGSTAGEGFFNPGGFSPSGVEMRDWGLPGGNKGAGYRSFVVWQSLSNVAGTVTVRFSAPGVADVTITRELGAYRRGGLSVSEITSVPAGTYVARITATQPIVAMLSQYQDGTGPGGQRSAVMSMGMPAGGQTEGIMAGARIVTGSQTVVTLAFAEQAPSIVTIDLDFFLNNGDQVRSSVVTLPLAASRKTEINLGDLRGLVNVRTGAPLDTLPRNEFFSVRFRAQLGFGLISADLQTRTAGDVAGTIFAGFATRTMFFADAFFDPTEGRRTSEFVSLFNPLTDPTLTVRYVTRFHFDDDGNGVADEVISTPSATLGALRRVDLSPQDFAPVLAKIQSGTQFRRFSISVDVTILSGATELTQPAGIVGHLTSLDEDELIAIQSGPTFGRQFPAVPLSDPIFDQTGGTTS